MAGVVVIALLTAGCRMEIPETPATPAEADRQAPEDDGLEAEKEAIRAALADTEARRALIDQENSIFAGARVSEKATGASKDDAKEN